RQSARLEILAAPAESSALLLKELRRLMLERSVLRGQVLSFSGSEYGQGAAGANFLRRPDVRAEDVILPFGVLDDVVRHVVGIGDHRAQLRATGQHLKRGVLLYGPPGTGKTLTVRHLLGRTPGTTAVLLAGNSIRFITEAADLARAMQPAIVVLEDVDLVAMERDLHGGPQPLLFAVLDALDGLDGDADVAFILTTNRVDMLEQALAQRPGRVDLAVEIPLPDTDARRRLFALYARELPLSELAVRDAADRADGVSGSFAKELMRRTVLIAAQENRTATDADLSTALDGLLSAREHLTRSLLGRGEPAHPAPLDPHFRPISRKN
ncbi:MAG TPA: ATP-binding protein, partial [Intrasporangium sp.]|uniref:ATP-binding protein n=1 Tax=Intrasporangium sp. TaxID=1925024 RepID=UPI002F955A43